MKSGFYQLPLQPGLIIQKKQHPVCSLKESIAQNIHLLISSYRGEGAYSDDFGCSLWDEEFNIHFNLRWKEELCLSLANGIGKYEKRLQLTDVKASMEEQKEIINKEQLRARRCLHVEVNGTIKKTNDAFYFKDRIYISPLSQK